VGKHLRILGCRGVPARHGGFETFAERLSVYLVSRGWKVTVYCQENRQGDVVEDRWKGVDRVRIPVSREGPLGTVLFDLKSALHACGKGDLVLTLGYNTAAFCVFYRLRGTPNLINMDGIEWQRAKWSTPARAWFHLNERLGCLLGSHLIADHPEIETHLRTRVPSKKITMIPYGGEEAHDADPSVLTSLGLEQNGFALVVARPEPENHILEIVKAFSAAHRDVVLAILGEYDPLKNLYHRAVIDAANEEVLFLGAVYEKDVLDSLRRWARLYLHGHSVGGTNPALVEALAAPTPVLAHDNRFNRWVAGGAARYFSDTASCERAIQTLLSNSDELDQMRVASRARFREAFEWDSILSQYEELLTRWTAR
jgi:glycosyltransferase involved in cell wall biosynthesis